jgi:hypothetical protein
MERIYKVAGIDVHKSMLAVVIADAARQGEFQFQRRKFTTLASGLEQLAAWLRQADVQEAVMESRSVVLEAGVAATGRAMRVKHWRRRNPTGRRRAARGITRMPSVCCGGTWRGADSELRTEP